jgi:hypothetical protein
MSEPALFGPSGINPMELIAGVVRNASRCTPRPTPLRAFAEEPYSLPQPLLDGLLAKMKHDLAYQDVQMVRDDNGEIYLFSTDYLTPAWAKNLLSESR